MAGGVLQLAASQSFEGLIAGFASPRGVTEEIDLQDIAFATATETFTEASVHLSGTLTVTDGTHTANLTLLGQYSTGDFSLSKESGTGTGTIVTDPALSASTAGTFLATPHT